MVKKLSSLHFVHLTPIFIFFLVILLSLYTISRTIIEKVRADGEIVVTPESLEYYPENLGPFEITGTVTTQEGFAISSVSIEDIGSYTNSCSFFDNEDLSYSFTCSTDDLSEYDYSYYYYIVAGSIEGDSDGYSSEIQISTPQEPGILALYPDEGPFEAEVGQSTSITGFVDSTSEFFTYFSLYDESDTEISNCDTVYIDGITSSFSCSTEVYEEPGTFNYTVRVDSEGVDPVVSESIPVTVGGEEEDLLPPVINISTVPTKTNNNSFVIKGNVNDIEGSTIGEINLLFDESTTTCTCSDGSCDTSSEDFTCTINILNQDLENLYCVEAFDSLLNRTESCRSVAHTSEITDNLMAHFRFNNSNPLVETIGYGTTGTWNQEGSFTSIPGFDQEARSFGIPAYISMKDYNSHYNFNGASDQFYVEAYVNISSPPGEYQAIVGKYNPDPNADYYKFSWMMGIDLTGRV